MSSLMMVMIDYSCLISSLRMVMIDYNCLMSSLMMGMIDYSCLISSLMMVRWRAHTSSEVGMICSGGRMNP